MGEHTFVIQTVGANDGSEKDALEEMREIAEAHGFSVDQSAEFHDSIHRAIFCPD